MTTENPLELKGSLSDFPFAELTAEIGQAQLSGSLRIAHKERKAIFYFDRGQMIHAVSNAREHRLFNFLLEKKKIDRSHLAKYPNFAKDLEFAEQLVRDGVLDRDSIDASIRELIESIIVDHLMSHNGDFLFSPLARLRGDMAQSIDISRMLADYARCQPADKIAKRFRSVDETFSVLPSVLSDGNKYSALTAQETALLARIANNAIKISELREAARNLPEHQMLHTLYVLWLGGKIARWKWNSAFTEAKIASIRSADLKLVRSAGNIAKTSLTEHENEDAQTEKPAEDRAGEAEVAKERPDSYHYKEQISLEEYLERVEKSPTYYNLLGVEGDALPDEIKDAYYGLAKAFHPDRFHREEGETLRRIQSAFTNLAHAYETLKNKESREAYDFKMRKELEEMEKRRMAGLSNKPEQHDVRAESSLASFEQGLAALNNDDHDAAATLLARAVHYSPDNALYHAYLGVALSANERNLHKAEAEMQTAVRLDPKNWQVRAILVQFLADMNMTKRAIGELQRYLAIVPGRSEAETLLRKLKSNQS